MVDILNKGHSSMSGSPQPYAKLLTCRGQMAHLLQADLAWAILLLCISPTWDWIGNSRRTSEPTLSQKAGWKHHRQPQARKTFCLNANGAGWRGYHLEEKMFGRSPALLLCSHSGTKWRDFRTVQSGAPLVEVGGATHSTRKKVATDSDVPGKISGAPRP